MKPSRGDGRAPRDQQSEDVEHHPIEQAPGTLEEFRSAPFIDIPPNPILSDFPGKTVAENLDHQLARVEFMTALTGQTETTSLFESVADETGLLAAAQEAGQSLDEIAQRHGFTSRSELFMASEAPDDLDDELVLETLTRYRDAKADAAASGLIPRRVGQFVLALGIRWPWVEAELCLAFEVAYLDSLVWGVPTTIVLSGGASAPLASEAVELEAFKMAPGEPVHEAMERLDAHERAVQEARTAMKRQSQPRMPIGRMRHKTRETLARDVNWYFRREVLKQSVIDIARDAFGDAANDRRRDIRAGVQRAERVLDLTSFRYSEDGSAIEPRDPDKALLNAFDNDEGGDEADLSVAAAEVSRAMARVATDPMGLVNLSFALALGHRSANAVEAADRALALAPDLLEARINRAMNLRALGRLEESLADLDLCLAVDATNPAVLHSMAASLRELGRLEEAVDFLTRELEVKTSMGVPPQFVSHSILDRARLYARLRRFPEADAAFDLACEVDPGSPEVWDARGNYRQARGMEQPAIDDLRRVTELDPDEPSAWNDLGSVLADAGRTDEALAALDRALELRPKYSAAHVNRGVAFWRAGRSTEAIREYQEAIQIDPLNAFPHMNLALILSDEQDQLDEALVHADLAVELNPLHPDCHAIRGTILHKLGRERDAAASLQRASQIDGWSPSTLYNLALVQSRVDLDSAIASLALFLSRFPEEAERARQDEGFEALRVSSQHRELFARIIG